MSFDQFNKDFKKTIKEVAETEQLKRKIADLERKVSQLEHIVHSIQK